MAAPSTPPHQVRARAPTPDAPLYGSFLDSPPRRSTRSTLTNNPYSSANVSTSRGLKSSRSSKLAPNRKLSFAISDAPSTPPASPTQPRVGPTSGVTHNGPANDNTTAQHHPQSLPAPSTSCTVSVMPPTPAKTPSLTPARKRYRAASLQDTARALHFQPEHPNDAMPTPQQSRKRRLTLPSKVGGEGLDADRPKHKARTDFTIYTETKARAPEHDTSSENVFRGRHSVAVPSAAERARQWDSSPSPPPRSRRTARDIHDEKRMDAAVKLGQGIVYTFRGRKMYKKFEDVDGPDLGQSSRQRALMRASGDTRPITRSAITPRLLFPRLDTDLDIDQGAFIYPHDTADEEAETDIDMPDVPVVHREEAESSAPIQPATPLKAKTRSKPMMSPPTTSRTTRAKQLDSLPSFHQTLDADDRADSVAVLPTPQRSSRKKKVAINSLPIDPEGTSEPVAARPDVDDLVNAPTPARSRVKKNVHPQLPPVREADEPPSADAARSPVGRRNTRSPFDHWPRTKSGRKRDVAAVRDGAPDTPSKRSRSGTRPARP